MSTTPGLEELKARRDNLRRRLASVGDLRPGSLVAQHRTCGNPVPLRKRWIARARSELVSDPRRCRQDGDARHSAGRGGEVQGRPGQQPSPDAISAFPRLRSVCLLESGRAGTRWRNRTSWCIATARWHRSSSGPACSRSAGLSCPACRNALRRASPPFSSCLHFLLDSLLRGRPLRARTPARLVPSTALVTRRQPRRQPRHEERQPAARSAALKPYKRLK